MFDYIIDLFIRKKDDQPFNQQIYLIRTCCFSCIWNLMFDNGLTKQQSFLFLLIIIFSKL